MIGIALFSLLYFSLMAASSVVLWKATGSGDWDIVFAGGFMVVLLLGVLCLVVGV